MFGFKEIGALEIILDKMFDAHSGYKMIVYDFDVHYGSKMFKLTPKFLIILVGPPDHQKEINVMLMAMLRWPFDQKDSVSFNRNLRF
jgi:hypothetical protein